MIIAAILRSIGLRKRSEFAPLHYLYNRVLQETIKLSVPHT